MNTDRRIITVGLTGAWDMHCAVDGIEWGDHTTVQSCIKIPAGKALNINKALAYLREKSVFTGLWGQDDYELLCDDLQLYNLIDNCVTPVPGATRTNITLEDTLNQRHLHLRFPDELCSAENLSQVTEQLRQLLQSDDLCVFAGSMPSEDLLHPMVELMNLCTEKGAQIILDSNGPGYARMIDECDITLISPNVSELSELLGQTIDDEPPAISKACGPLLEKVNIILVSRGKQGAMLITKEQSLTCTLASEPRPVVTEVGCGDHFLAGFLSVFSQDDQPLDKALAAGVQLATFHAWGLTQTESPDSIDENVSVEVKPVN